MLKYIKERNIKDIVYIKEYSYNNCIVSFEKDYNGKTIINVKNTQFPEISVINDCKKYFILINPIVLNIENQIDVFLKEIKDVKDVIVELKNNKTKYL